MINNPDTVYSIDEMYYYDMDSILEQIECNDEIEVIYKAEAIRYKHSDFISADAILEIISNSAYEQSDEFAESYCDSLNRVDDATKRSLEAVISEYLNAHIEQPNFYSIKNSTELTIEQFKGLV